MSPEGYFEAEMAYLREAGKEFAAAFPERAPYLDADALEDRDPFVERLFEGFAFLTARIRREFDDGFPELARHILSLLDPGQALGFPSLAMVEFDFTPGMLPRPQVVPRGTALSGRAGGRICRFTTTKDIRVLPLRLEAAEEVRRSPRGDGLRFRFRLDRGAELPLSAVGSIPLHLHGEGPLPWTLYGLLAGEVAAARLLWPGGEKDLGGQAAVSPEGFGEDESLLAPDLGGPGRILREYFAFARKFRGVVLGPWDARGLPGSPVEAFQVELYFRSPLPAEARPRAEHFRLHAAPAINLSPEAADPIRLDHRRHEYDLTVRGPGGPGVHQVISVTGTGKSGGKPRRYLPFAAFGLGDPAGPTAGHFSWRREWSRDRPRHYLSVGGFGPGEREEESLSVEVLAEDGALPAQGIALGGLCEPPPGFPGFLRFRNLTVPTAPWAPPPDRELWDALALLRLGQGGLADAGRLRSALALHDRGEGAKAAFRAAILAASARPRTYAWEGALVRGSEVDITLAAGAFPGGGELRLFARVLYAYLRAQANINQLLSLRVSLSPAGEGFVLGPGEGSCPSI